MNNELQSWADDLIYKHALTFSHDELAGMYALCNAREQEYLKEIKSLRLILQSHGEVIEENARLREALTKIASDQYGRPTETMLIARKALNEKSE